MRFFTIFLLFAHSLFGQSDTTSYQIEDVVIRGIKLDSVVLPFTISSHASNSPTLGLSINEFTYAFAGVFAMSANNFSQDSRLSSRGFGARSAFGIKGIKIIQDGIPLTTPDGLAQLDDVDFENLQNIQFMKGPLAGIYGNASGGALVLNSFPIDSNFLSIKFTHGSFGLFKYSFKAARQFKKLAIATSYSNISYKGFREWSEYENQNANIKLAYTFSNKNKITFTTQWLYNPIANDAGATTIDEFNLNHKAARDRNVLYKAGENVRQFRTSLQFQHSTSKMKNILAISAYVTKRDFENKLPFSNAGAVSIDRNLFGLNINFQNKYRFLNRQLYVNLGSEYDVQHDIRTQFANNEGTIGEKNFEQNEKFSNLAFYTIFSLHANTWLSFFLSARYDRILTKVKDTYISNGDQSGSRVLTSLNPSTGVNFSITKKWKTAILYSTGFESPSLIELSNNPSGSGGFNKELNPMKSKNIEWSVTHQSSRKWKNSFALYYVHSTNEIVAYEIDGQSGRSYYRNTGSTQRVGIEAESNFNISPMFSISWNGSISKMKYLNYLVFDNNDLPAIPKIITNTSITIHPIKHQKFDFNILHKYVGAMFADDANSIQIKPFHELNVKMDYQFQWNTFFVSLALGVNNFLDVNYFSNVRINAIGGRYFEAAMERNYFLAFGMKI